MRKLLLVPALLSFALCTASAKQYTVSFAKPVQVGTVQLAAGEYKLKVEGEKAIFTDSHKKSFTAPAKLVKISKKSTVTAVETKEANGSDRLDAIDLDGADFKLVF